MKIYFKFAMLAFLMMVLAHNSALATVNTANPSPARKTIHDEKPITLRIIWRVRGSGVTAPVTVDMDDGNIYLGNDQTGTFIDTLSGSQSRSITSINNGSYETTFTENITVTRALIQQAKNAKQPLAYVRQFSDDAFTTTFFGVVRFDLASGIGGNLEITRLRLTFDEGQSLCTVEAGSNLKAHAYLQAEGTGMLRGDWQTRTDPHSSSFRTLRNVRMPVNAGRDIELISPPLPTNTSGRVDVRFVVTDPSTQFQAPFVTCIIKGNEKNIVKHDLPGQPAEVTSPTPYAPLTQNTLVRWKPVEGVKSYRIYILRENDGVPIAAQDTAAGAAEAKISALTLSKIDSKQRYLIRVFGQ